MGDDSTKALGRVILIDESEIRGHLNELVRGTVEETLNGLLDVQLAEGRKAWLRQVLAGVTYDGTTAELVPKALG